MSIVPLPASTVRIILPVPKLLTVFRSPVVILPPEVVKIISPAPFPPVLIPPALVSILPLMLVTSTGSALVDITPVMISPVADNFTCAAPNTAALPPGCPVIAKPKLLIEPACRVTGSKKVTSPARLRLAVLSAPPIIIEEKPLSS